MKNIVRILFLTYSINGHCFDFVIKCDEPNGLRVDYYFANTIGFDNNKFIPSLDKISGASPMIFFSKTKALLILQDTQLAGGNPHKALLNYVIYNEDQIAMSGLLNQAPYLVSYFPKLDILFISSQKNMFFSGYNANSQMFSSKCGKPITKAEFEEEFLKKYPNGGITLEKINSF